VLSPLPPLLSDALAGGYAIGSFTAFNMESARGIFEALEQQQVPAIVAVTRRMTPFMDFEGLAAYLRARAERADSPVTLHLDHATDVDLVRRALDAGFTSVQYDAVGVALAEKTERTRAVADLAHSYGAVMESELEHIGRTGVEDGGGLTQPEVAQQFVGDTSIDVLAVSIGTVHGLSRGEAHINLELLADIRSRVPAFLALHGGTGAPPTELVASIRGGIVKVSYFHGMALEALARLRGAIDETPHGMIATLLDGVRPAFRDRCLEMIAFLGSPDRPPAAVEPAGI
jgi:fructose-bisphosphate aldolase class II